MWCSCDSVVVRGIRPVDVYSGIKFEVCWSEMLRCSDVYKARGLLCRSEYVGVKVGKGK
ncbi:MAG: hypothetical protein ACKERG_00925 [Candidatus Hodgkinia cicadicola]